MFAKQLFQTWEPPTWFAVPIPVIANLYEPEYLNCIT